MALKKLIAIGLSLGLALGTFGCNNKENTTTDKNTTNNSTNEESTITDTEYANRYYGLYNNNISPLNNYAMYRSVEDVNNAYKDKDYPGNEKYVTEVKSAYEDSKEKIQAFIDGLKNDVQTEDKDLKDANDKLIAQGEILISEIDEKIKKLDTIPKDAYTKTKDEFIKLVDDTTKVENDASNEFDKMIQDMNKMLGIDTKQNTNNTK